MGNLFKLIPQTSEVVQKIYDWHKRLGDAEPERGYLGASIIGHECDRFLWYNFRQCVSRDFSGRLYRLFETGDLAEPRFVKELRGIGCTVHEVDAETGKQFEVTALGGHFSGHMDGVGQGIPGAPSTWHVLEFKTHNAKSFAKLQKDGVKKSKPQHHAQMQVYMGLNKMKRALYLAVNKDTDELYAERVRFDSTEYDRLMDRAERIIRSVNTPPRMADRPDDFRCRFCDAKELCWGTSDVAVPLPNKSCRTCCHATPEIDDGETWARWSCAHHKRDLSPSEQQRACDSHLLLPGLVGFADVADAGEDWIEFHNHSDGAVWRHSHGADGSTWTTDELMAAPGPLVGDSKLAQVKATFDAQVVGFEVPNLPLLARYDPADARRLWHGSPDDMADIETTMRDAGESVYAEPSGHEEDDEHLVVEWSHRIALVIYKAHNHAAIYEGVE